MKINIISILCLCISLLIGCINTNENSLEEIYTEENFVKARKDMVNAQLRARGIRDEHVLEAMLKVERHKFVPRHIRYLAYTDQPLPIGEEQTISQPYIVALMTELLNLDGDEKTLEIGTGSGYQTAILAELSRYVYTIEILEPLIRRAKNLLKNLGYNNITFKCGDGYKGWQEYAPFDRIIVTCAPSEIPQPLIEQLAEGGKMIIPVGVYRQKLKLIKKEKGEIETVSIIPVKFVPMIRK